MVVQRAGVGLLHLKSRDVRLSTRATWKDNGSVCSTDDV